MPSQHDDDGDEPPRPGRATAVTHPTQRTASHPLAPPRCPRNVTLSSVHLEKAMTTPNSLSCHVTQALRASIAGDVFVPGEHGYDHARQAWNLFADQQPAAVVFAESAADVACTVKFAAAQGMRTPPRGPGPGPPSLEPLEDAILLKTARMRRVEIDPAIRTARAEA